MESLKHFENCNAPICADETAYTDNPNWKKTVAWYPGESVCGKTPYAKWQKRQTKMNRWLAAGRLKYPGFFFTVETLLQGANIKAGRKGDNPDSAMP